MNAGTQTAARRYARALLEVAVDQKLDGSAVRQELEAWATLLEGHAEARDALTSPAVGTDARLRAVRALAARVEASPLMRRLLEVLAQNGRMDLLPALARAFAAQWNAQRGVTAARAITAVPLDAAQREALAQALALRSGGPVELTTAVDPAVLGGMVVRMGGRTYDGSVRARLATLRARLSGAAG